MWIVLFTSTILRMETAKGRNMFECIPEDKRGMGTIVCMSREKTLLSRDVLVMPVSMI